MALSCKGCGLPIERAEDGTCFVFGTRTTADGVSFCPPDPDGEPEGVHEPEMHGMG